MDKLAANIKTVAEAAKKLKHATASIDSADAADAVDAQLDSQAQAAIENVNAGLSAAEQSVLEKAKQFKGTSASIDSADSSDVTQIAGGPRDDGGFGTFWHTELGLAAALGAAMAGFFG